MLEDPNYYLYESEIDVLKTHWKSIVTTFGCKEFNLVDMGAGDGKKVKILLDGAL